MGFCKHYNELRKRRERTYKYFKIETIHEEVNYHLEEENKTIVELGIGCNGKKHAATLTRLFLIDDEIVHGEFIHDFELGKCTCSLIEKNNRQDIIGGFVLTKDLRRK